MKPFDDSVPEEIETQHADLVSMLRHVYPRPVQLTTDKQAQIIERASQRLLTNDQAVSGDRDEIEQPVGVAPSNPITKLASSPFAVRRGKRLARFASMLAAVLVIAALISGSLLLFRHEPQRVASSLPRGAPIGPVATSVTAHTEAGGLEASMSVTPGPYFLSELLAVDLSLTNHGQTTFMLVGRSSDTYSICDESPLSVESMGESAPFYTLPQMPFLPCPGGGSTQIKPGQTISIREYYVLRGSGHVTLTEGARFLSMVVDSHGNTSITVVKSALDGHWPTMQINVNAVVPADRTLSFHMQGTHAFIDASLAAQHHLLYEYQVSCQDFPNQGDGEIGAFTWQPIHGNKVSEPSCQGKNVKWTFAFGAPGYAIVQGSVTFPENSPNP